MPSFGIIQFVTNFLRVPERMEWIGLDVGCGTHLGVLAEYGLSIEKITKFENKEYPIQKYIEGNVYDIPLPDNSFDYVVSSNLFEHLEDLQTAIREVARVAKHVVITQVPRYTIKLEEVTPCTKLDHYYLCHHPELWEPLGLNEDNVIYAGRIPPKFGENELEAPHCQWFPEPHVLTKVFEDSGLFTNVEVVVNPRSCGELIATTWLETLK